MKLLCAAGSLPYAFADQVLQISAEGAIREVGPGLKVKQAACSDRERSNVEATSYAQVGL